MISVMHGPKSRLPDMLRAMAGHEPVQLMPQPGGEPAPAGPWVVELGTLTPEHRARLHAARPDGRGVIIVGDRTLRPQLAELFEHRALRHLLSSDDPAHSRDLDVTLRKLTGPQTLGAAPYLGQVQKTFSCQVHRAAEKRDAVTEAQRFARNAGAGSRYETSFCTVADELISNAIFNAPASADGTPRFAHLSRDVDVTLAPGEAVSVKMDFDGERLALAVADPFGTLTVSRVQQSMARCLRRGPDQVNFKPGGAGIGLYYSFELVSHLVINLIPGRVTEVIGLIDVKSRYRDWVRRAKSLNIFEEGSA
jgi:hypothetical protein